MNEIINAWNGGASAARPGLTLTRANMKGTGSALRLELHPAKAGTSGHVMMAVAAQSSLPGTGTDGVPVPAGFDWAHSLRVDLGLADIGHILEVMCGMAESVLDGKGIFHASRTGSTIIQFAHQIEPVLGYVLNIFSRAKGEEREERRYYFMSPNECFALMMAIENSLGAVAFGVPSEL